MSELDGIKKKLKIYKDDDDYVLQRVNEFGTSFTSRHSKASLIESLNDYKYFGGLEKYDIDTSDDLWPLVINTLSQSE